MYERGKLAMYSPRYSYDGLPSWKRKKDPILTRIFYRPISYLFSSVFASVGIGANAVSYLSALVALVACACFVVGASVAGAILINIWV